VATRLERVAKATLVLRKFFSYPGFAILIQELWISSFVTGHDFGRADQVLKTEGL
jgi:hypothetical protein